MVEEKEKMKINVGSQNPVKISAVEEILKDYPHLSGAQVIGVKASSEVSDQPKSLEETVLGAKNRARNAFKDCVFSIGLESGLFSVPHSKTGHMDTCICCIFDGKEYHFGMSSGWEFPKKEVLDLIFNNGLDMNQAMFEAGLTSKKNIGSEEGAISFFTKGRLDRKEYTKQALRTALIHLDV